MKNKKIILSSLFVIGLVSITCLKFAISTAINIKVDINEVVNNTKFSDTQKSQLLTRYGEWLLTPMSYYSAYQVFKKAYELDIANTKAEFYITVLKPTITMKGFLKRIEPLMSKTEGLRKQLLELRNQYASQNIDLYKYLLDGTPDINVESDLQQLLKEIYKDQNAIRKFAANNKQKTELKLNISDFFDLSTHTNFSPYGYGYGYGNGVKREYDPKTDQTDYVFSKQEEQLTACRIRAPQPGLFLLENCNVQKRQQLGVDAVDFEYLEQYITAYMIENISFTAYNATGFAIFQSVVQNGKNLNVKLKRLFYDNPDFGKLLNDNQLSLISSLGVDAILGYKRLKSVEDKECGPPYYFLNEKRNRNLTNLCPAIYYDKELKQSKNNIDALLALAMGNITPIVFGKVERRYTARTYLKPFMNGEIKDLENLGISIADDSYPQFEDQRLGGIFPDGDANKVVEVSKPDKKNKK